MKTLSATLVLVLICCITLRVSAQVPDGTPFKSTEAPVYGTDVIIHDNASENQRHAKIAVASNGWLFAAFGLVTGGYRLARSTDNGVTWMTGSIHRAGYYLNAVDLVVTGADTASMRIWVASAGYMKVSIDVWDVSVEKIDPMLNVLGTTSLDGMISNFGYPDVAIATDFGHPSTGASPFSIGVIFSKIGTVGDNIIFRSSADGGATFANTRSLPFSGHWAGNVALAFGRSLSHPEGRYVAAWDKQTDFTYYGSYYGQIFTSHTLALFDGEWSAPEAVDTVGGGLSNSAKDPSLACQSDVADNGSGSFSALLTFDRKLDSQGTKSCVIGLGNTNPAGGASWSEVFVSGSGSVRDFEGDAAYDATGRRFLVTWADSLNSKLKCGYDGLDFPANPGSWTLLSAGYNDGTAVSNPFPRVKVVPGTGQAVHVWDGDRSASVTNTTFDNADPTVGVGGTPVLSGPDARLFPNPCRSETSLDFVLDKPGQVVLALYDVTGREIPVQGSGSYDAGHSRVRLDTSSFREGIYFLSMKAGGLNRTFRLIVF